MPSLSEAKVMKDRLASNSKLSYLEKRKKQRQVAHSFRYAVKHMTHTQPKLANGLLTCVKPEEQREDKD
ncbi:MAG: hypothetical protein WAU36_14655 [Cyclobacteriaceae bacterium]